MRDRNARTDADGDIIGRAAAVVYSSEDVRPLVPAAIGGIAAGVSLRTVEVRLVQREVVGVFVVVVVVAV